MMGKSATPLKPNEGQTLVRAEKSGSRQRHLRPTVSGHVITTTTRDSLTNELPRRLLRCQTDLVDIIPRPVMIR